MERLMQYVWQHRLWPPQAMATVDGHPVHVIDPGRLNTDSGPDFFNAKVKIDGHLWAGDVEIHVRASDWHRHNHDSDPAYDSVILHVVDRDDTRIRRHDGNTIPQMCMPCSPELRAHMIDLVERAALDLPCSHAIAHIPGIYLTDWLSTLTFERMHAKADRIESMLTLTAGDLETATYITLARALGFGTNSDPFERLARATPLRTLLKQADDPMYVESILFGQSGLLDSAPAGADPYVEALRSHYRFHAHKLGLEPLQSPGWKMARMRPANFPHRRIAWLAAIISNVRNLRGAILEVNSADDLSRLFDHPTAAYWHTHYHFSDTPSPSAATHLSRSTLQLLAINVVAPVIFHQGVRTDDATLTTRAIDLLETLPPERNSIVTMFERAGLKPRDAASSQALIHLRRTYCEARKCLYCRLGHRILASKAQRHTSLT